MQKNTPLIQKKAEKRQKKTDGTNKNKNQNYIFKTNSHCYLHNLNTK